MEADEQAANVVVNDPAMLADALANTRALNEQHTPGPWYTSKDAVPEGIVQVTVASEETGERVATVFQTEANARLIAAAPDLLAACRNVLETFMTGQLDPELPQYQMRAEEECVRNLRAAIEKATG